MFHDGALGAMIGHENDAEMSIHYDSVDPGEKRDALAEIVKLVGAK